MSLSALAATTILIAAMSTTTLSASPVSTPTRYILYVGVYGKHIYAYRFNTADAEITPIGPVADIINPSFLATDADHKHLYAVSELTDVNVEGGVAAYDVDRASGALKLLNELPSGGVAPCHLAVDHTGQILAVANYTSGGVAGFPLAADGRLEKRSCLMECKGSSVNPIRQDGPHAHEVVFSHDNRLLYVPDLGLDQIRVYSLNLKDRNLKADDRAVAKLPPGSGPRHITFSRDNRFAYLITELASTVVVFSHDPATGILTEVQSASTLSTGFSGESSGAEIALHPSGKFLYASNRGPGAIAVFSVDSVSGKVKQSQIATTGTTFPRAFEIDPSGRFLVAGDQKADQFVVFRIDLANGHLTLTGGVHHLPSPVSFLFVPAQ